MNSRRWSNITKIIVGAILAILAIILLVTFRVMIVPTIVAFLLAFILSYPVNWITRRTGWPRSATVGLLYLILFAAAIIFPVMFLPRVDVAGSINETVEELIAGLQSATSGMDFAIGPYALSPDNAFQQLSDVLQGFLVSTGNPFIIFRNFTTGILTVLYVLVLNFWLLKDWQQFQRGAIERVPGDYQEEVRRIGSQLGAIWDAFLRGQVVLAIVIGFISWLALSLLGMPNAGGLALLAAFMEFLPTIGPGISMAVGTGAALFRGSNFDIFGNNFTYAIIVLLTYNVITWFESAYLIPRLVGARVRLHPAVTFVAIISGALSFGLLGVLLATPVVASARVLLDYVYNKMLDRDPFESPESGQPAVRIRGLIAGRKIDGIVFDLDGTLTKLDWRIADWFIHKSAWLEPILPVDRRWRLAQRAMILMEGSVNFVINRLARMELTKDLARLQPLFDGLRAYPPPDRLTLQPGVDAMLRTLHREYKLGLVTTRPRDEVCAFLARNELHNGAFDAVVAREDVRNLQPHSEALLMAVEEMELNPDNVLVICDSDGSLRSSGAANMATAGVAGGLSRSEDFTNADLILADADELADWL